MINFAHGEVVMLGGFAGYFTLQLCIRWGWVAADAPILQSWMAVLFPIAMGMLASLLIAVALERIAYRPLRGAQRLIPLISAIGASFFLQYSALLIFGVTPHNYQKPAVLTGAVKLGETRCFRIQDRPVYHSRLDCDDVVALRSRAENEDGSGDARGG